MSDPGVNEDAVFACADLVGRAGASEFQFGYTGEETDENPRWYAHARYQGARIQVQDRHTPTEACTALAERLLRGAMCRCRKQVALSGFGSDYFCRWRLVGRRWEPGCDAPSVKVKEGERGDMAAMRRAMGVSDVD
jgi:hypothetical protein